MRETTLGGPKTAFPETQWTCILQLQEGDDQDRRERLQDLIQSYWKPVYAVLRKLHRLSIEESKDATQAFFTQLLQRDFLKNVSASKGSFRTYLKVSLRNFMVDEARKQGARKRSGEGEAVKLRVEEMEPLLEAAPTPEDAFEREWRRTIIEAALESLGKRLKAAGKPLYYEVFRAYLDAQLNEGPRLTYSTVAERLAITESDVRNYLHHAREVFREEVVRVLRETTSSPAELEAEVRELFGS